MISLKIKYNFVSLGFLLSFLFAGCSKIDITRDVLEELDSMSYSYPRYVYNRAEQMRTVNTSSYKRAYIGLLMTMSGYNAGVEFTSDSLINFAVDEFKTNQELLARHYLRSLIYQGIIRNQLGSVDGNAYLPIKEALDIDNEKKVLDTRTKQLANYQLGLIHNQNNNIITSHEYFKEALMLAEKMQDSIVLFKTYRDMYWNRMKGMDFSTAQALLESMQSFQVDTEEQLRDVKNAESAFYNSKKNYRNALQLDYELMEHDRKQNDSIALLADYYRISENYKYLGELDSALWYGELAVQSIVDTTYYLNFHYYLNVAEIADQLNDTEKSNAAYREVYRLQNRAINRQLNTQILELERKYDVASAENRAIRLKNSNLWLQLIIVISILTLVIIYLLFRQRIKIQREREKQMRIDKQLAERKLVEKQFVIPIYRQISQRNLSIKNFLLDLQSNTFITKNQPLLEKIENEYKNFVKTTKISDTQFLSDELFASLTGISEKESRLFNESEKMMMAFIAIGADNQQMATLLNTSVESVRVRKSKLKRKMEENKVKIPDDLLNEEP